MYKPNIKNNNINNLEDVEEYDFRQGFLNKTHKALTLRK